MTDAIDAPTFRAATEADVPFLLELRRQTMSEHLRASGATRARVRVSLSVLKANPARQLYERLGFRIVGQNDHAYDMEFEG